MPAVKVSSRFQVVLPSDVRESLGITAGQEVEIFQYEDRVELIPVRKVSNARGFLSGLDTAVPREADRI